MGAKLGKARKSKKGERTFSRIASTYEYLAEEPSENRELAEEPCENVEKPSEHRESPTMHDFSPFELLPQELFFKIVDFAPEAVLELRQTSRFLHSRMNCYALQPTTLPLVRRLCVSNDCAEEDPIHFVVVVVAKDNAKLWEMRLKARQPEQLSRIMRTCREEEDAVEYTIICKYDDGMLLKTLRASMGKQVGKLWMSEYEDKEELGPVSTLLKGLVSNHLEFLISTFSDEAIDHLLSRIIEHKIDRLTLSTIEFTRDGFERLLHELPSLIRSLCIYRHPRDVNSTHFFGIPDADWEVTLRAIFAARLDKLKIDIPGGSLHLSIADAIRRFLPALGRKVWFEVQCVCYPTGVTYRDKECIISVDRSDAPNALLSIKHVSRVSEPFEA